MGDKREIMKVLFGNPAFFEILFRFSIGKTVGTDGTDTRGHVGGGIWLTHHIIGACDFLIGKLLDERIDFF